MRKLLKLSIFLGLFLFALTLTSNSFAINDNTSASNSDSDKKFKQFRAPETKDSTKSANKDRKNMALADKKASAGAMRKVKLSEGRLKLCEAKENAIGNRFKNLLALGVKTHTGMDKIIERVDGFYNTVLVPQGHVLSNYDALKADIAAKKASVKTALEEAQASGQSFSCDSADPKGQADLFRQDVGELIAANKAYKASARAFVVAVKDLAMQAKADKLSPSPVISPVVSPVITEAPGI